MRIYSRWTLRWIPELAPFSPAERVLLWKRAAQGAGQDTWLSSGVVMGLIGGFGGVYGSRVAHPLVGSAIGGMLGGVVAMLLMSRSIERRLNEEIRKLGRGPASPPLQPTSGGPVGVK